MALHGGSVMVESAGAGEGSVFTVRMPLAQPPATLPAQPPAASEAPAAAPLRVLVIDDSQDVAQTIGWMLEEMGHDYRLLHDGREALDAARAYQPDAILLDIGMPGMNGYEVCRMLRRDERLGSVPIIAQTGWGQEKDKASAAEAGFDHHLVKPVGFGALEALLASLTVPDARV
jgi:CheY-like chemotaxis protein